MAQDKVEYNESKFKELMLYVASRMLGDPSYGTVKFNKVLFFSDFLHYAHYGQAITGVPYVHRRLGPAPRGVKRLQEDLFAAQEATMATVQNGTRVQKMLVAQRPADLSGFTGSEIAIVETVLTALREHTAMEASELSHAMLAWQLAAEGETIPYHWVFLYDGPPTHDDELFAKELAEIVPADLLASAT